jgi:hypothetical protein
MAYAFVLFLTLVSNTLNAVYPTLDRHLLSTVSAHLT